MRYRNIMYYYYYCGGGGGGGGGGSAGGAGCAGGGAGAGGGGAQWWNDYGRQWSQRRDHSRFLGVQQSGSVFRKTVFQHSTQWVG